MNGLNSRRLSRHAFCIWVVLSIEGGLSGWGVIVSLVQVIFYHWRIWVAKETWPGCMREALKFAVEENGRTARVLGDSWGC